MSIMALVGPKVLPANFSDLMYTLRRSWDVPGRGGGVLASSLTLGAFTAILPVPNGHWFGLFISVTSLLDVDSPKGRLLPRAASALSPRPLLILDVHRLVSVDFFSPIFMA